MQVRVLHRREGEAAHTEVGDGAADEALSVVAGVDDLAVGDFDPRREAVGEPKPTGGVEVLEVGQLVGRGRVVVAIPSMIGILMSDIGIASDGIHDTEVIDER